MTDARSNLWSGWDCGNCGLPLRWSDIIAPTQHCRFCGSDHFVSTFGDD